MQETNNFSKFEYFAFIDIVIKEKEIYLYIVLIINCFVCLCLCVKRHSVREKRGSVLCDVIGQENKEKSYGSSVIRPEYVGRDRAVTV